MPFLLHFVRSCVCVTDERPFRSAGSFFFVGGRTMRRVLFEIAGATTDLDCVRGLVSRAAARVSNTVVAVTTSSTISIRSSSGLTFLEAPIQAPCTVMRTCR